ncbi:MAG: T9SS type A sorting domain-containing protein, partial [Flavobacteriia bacterium]
SNGTIVGPRGNGTVTLPIGEKFEKAFRLRRNTSTSVLNSLVTGWEKGLSIEGTPVVNNVNGDSLVFAHNSLTNFNPNTYTIYNAGTSGGAASTAAFYLSFMGPDGNDTTQTLAQINWVNAFTALGITPDARLAAGSTAATNGNFMHPKFYSVATPVVATNSFTYCQGATATALSATALTIYSLRWYTQPTGGTYTTTAPVPSTTTAGTYTYYVSQANAGNDESMRAAITVVVNALPATPTITASGSTSFCTGGSVDLTSSAASGNTWSTNATTATITVATTGSYTVTVTDANGCASTSAPISVNVSNAPAPTISASSTQACSGDVVTVTSSAADSYSWSTGETTQSIQVTDNATVTVTVTNANACNGVGQSAATTITFTATPTAAGSFTTAGNVVTFANTSTGATSYSWDFGDFTNSSATAPTHAYAANGSYTVVLTAINGNCSSTATFEISIEVGLEEANAMNLMVYPNPASTQVLVAFDNTAVGSVQIIDAMGRIVVSESLNTIGAVALPIHVSQLADGTYTIQVTNANQVGIRRLVVRN